MFTYLSNLAIVLATSSQDLFNNAWTEGNLNSISWLTTNLGGLAGKIISVVGFCIVIFSILKNAISGLYVVNPNLWDKVDDLKRAAAGEWTGSGASGGFINNMGNGMPGQANQVFNKIGGAMGFCIALLPNIKELTDFEDGKDIDKKQYFTKSMIAMVFQIFIGVLIFFGYPSQFASWIGSFGTAAIDMVITNVDPIATLNMVADKTSNLQWIYGDSEKPTYEYYVREGAQAAYTSIVGTNNDIQAAPRQLLANNLENWLYDSCMGHREIIGAFDGYTTSVNAAYVSAAPIIPEGATPINVANGQGYAMTSQSGTVTVKVWRTVNSFETGSTSVGESDYVVVSYTSTRVAVKNTSTVYANAHLKSGTAIMTSNKQFKIPLTGVPYSEQTSVGAIDGTPGSCDVTYYSDAGEGFTVNGRLDVTGSQLSLILDGNQKDVAAKLGNGAKAVITFGYTGNFKYTAGGANAQQEIKVQQLMINCKYNAEGQLDANSTGGISLSTGNAGDVLSSPDAVFSAVHNQATGNTTE